jgi:hypothetical protein
LTGSASAAGHYGWYPEAYGRVTLGVQALTRRALPTLDGGTFVRTFRPSVFDIGVVTQAWHGVRLPISTPGHCAHLLISTLVVVVTGRPISSRSLVGPHDLDRGDLFR